MNDKFTLKKTGYSSNGRPLLFVPKNVDIAFFDFENNGYRKVTNNYEQMLLAGGQMLKLLPSFDDLLSNVFFELPGITGYYLLNHSTQKAEYLGNGDQWDEIVTRLDGKHVETFFAA